MAHAGVGDRAEGRGGEPGPVHGAHQRGGVLDIPSFRRPVGIFTPVYSLLPTSRWYIPSLRRPV
eukprot:4141858-Pyramimonas_sp.AAC.1